MFERLGFTPGMTDLVERYPEYFTRDVVAFQYPYSLLARDDLPEDIAYNMAKVFDQYHEEMVQICYWLNVVTPQLHIEYAGPPFEIHPGVIKYYEEQGYL